MPQVPQKVSERISDGIINYQPILKSALQRDINKSGTNIIVVDIINDLLGFKKYREISNDFFIKKTFCDLALSIDDNPAVLVEIKAVGLPLAYEHIMHAHSYGKAHNLQQVVLTNGIEWRLYDCNPEKPRSEECMLSFNFLELDPYNKTDIEKVFALSKEGIQKSSLRDLKEKESLLNRYMIGALVLSDDFIDAVKKELKKIDSFHEFDSDDIHNILKSEIIKREVIENEEIKRSIKRIKDASYGNKKDRRTVKPIISPSKIPDSTINLDAI